MRRAPHPRRSTPLLKNTLSHDTAGPYPVSMKRERYLHLVVHNYSGKMFAKPLHSKSQAPVHIMAAIRAIKANNGKCITRVHSDGAREYSSAQLRQKYELEGITMTKTAPDSPASNGIAERAIQKVNRAIRAALLQSKLPDSYWTWAALDAIDKFNALPRSNQPHLIPNEVLPMPDDKAISSFLPFGTVGFIRNTASLSKTHPRAVKARYLRAINQGTYEVKILNTDKVTSCRSTEFHPCSSVAAVTAPKSLKSARKQGDYKLWARAHDTELNRHIKQLKTWHYERRRPTDKPVAVIMTYKSKTNENGQLEMRKARCAVRGDLMRSGFDYNVDHISSHSPSPTAIRILLAEAAYNDHYLEAWDVPGAYMRAPRVVHNEPEPRQTMSTPPWSSGAPTMQADQVAVADKAVPGAPDAGWLWERHRNEKLKGWGWSQLTAEPSAFIYKCPNTGHVARMLCSTDDFLVTAESRSLITWWYSKLQSEWQITRRSPVTQHLGIKIEVKDKKHIAISNPKLIDRLLSDNGLQNAKPAALPYITTLNLDIWTKADKIAPDNIEKW
eukprot:IDg5367t1